MINNVACSWNWRMANAEGRLASDSFARLRIPVPDTVSFKDNSLEVDLSQGGQRLHGHINLSMLWATLSNTQLSVLVNKIEAIRVANGQLYLTIEASNGFYPGLQWIDIRGRPHRPPELSPAGSLAGRVRGASSFNSVTLFVNSITVVNNPSLFTV